MQELKDYVLVPGTQERIYFGTCPEDGQEYFTVLNHDGTAIRCLDFYVEVYRDRYHPGFPSYLLTAVVCQDTGPCTSPVIRAFTDRDRALDTRDLLFSLLEGTGEGEDCHG